MSTATAAPAESDDDLLLVEEAAAVLRVNPDWVRRQCHAGKLPAKKLGKGWRIRRADLRRFTSTTEAIEPAQGGRGRKTARQRRRST